MNRIAGFVVGLALAVGAAPAMADSELTPDQRALETEQHMVLYFGGLRVGNMTINAKLRQGHYLMQSQLEAGGIASLFTDSTVNATSFGTVDETGSLSPRHYRYEIASDGNHERTSEMAFQPDGSVDFSSTPEYGADEQKAPVPLAQQQGSLDPLTAGLFNLSFAPDGALCEGTVKVYDGRRRYDLHLQPAGEDTLSSRRAERYSGPAVKCQLVYERHKSFDEAVPVSKRSKSYEPMTIWFAPMPAPDGGAPVFMPVKLLAHSDYGAFVAHSEKRTVKPLAEALNIPH